MASHPKLQSLIDKAVFDYFQKAYDADPESEYAPRIAKMLVALKEEIERTSGDGKQR